MDTYVSIYTYINIDIATYIYRYVCETQFNVSAACLSICLFMCPFFCLCIRFPSVLSFVLLLKGVRLSKC